MYITLHKLSDKTLTESTKFDPHKMSKHTLQYKLVTDKTIKHKHSL